MGTVSARLEQAWGETPGIASWFKTVDHKRIGKKYLYTGLAFFVLGGIEALLLRIQLAGSNLEVLDPETYNQIFTMHGTTMMFLFAVPVLSGFGNYIVPLMLGARDMAFPRLNAFGYWAFLSSGIFLYSSFIGSAAPNAGWFNYVPLSDEAFAPGLNIDFYNIGLILLGVSTTAGAINFIVTIFKLRAPGMSINRMPIFVWGELAMALAIVFAQPTLTAALVMLELQRRFGFHFFDVAGGGEPELWQHLFWVFGHPWVYIIILPAFGIVSMTIPVFSRRPIVGYTYVVLAEMAVALIGFGVWVHHMFATGVPSIAMSFISLASFMIAVPSGVQVFAWLTTLVTGRLVVNTPMLFSLGFVVLLVVGGLSGVMFASVPFDQQTTDSYFVVAHIHYVLMGAAVFPIFAGLYYWLPKITGKMLDERLGKWSFWIMFVGFNAAFGPMHVVGLLGQPRRTYTYEAGLGWEIYNLVETIGSFLLTLGILITFLNWFRSRRGADAPADPWGADTLEWATGSPAPDYNFEAIPVVASRHPVWDQPELADGVSAQDGFPLIEGHETLATSLLDAAPEAVLEMPHETIWPFALSAALLVTGYGLLFSAWSVVIVGALGVVTGILGWFWPRGETQET